MANDFSGQVWYIDTVMAGEAPAFKNCDVYVRSINWSKMASADLLTITDRNGRILFDLNASAANLNINLPSLGWVQGIIVTSVGTAGANVQIAIGSKD